MMSSQADAQGKPEKVIKAVLGTLDRISEGGGQANPNTKLPCT